MSSSHSELEDYVDCLQRNSASGQLPITLTDMEEGAVNLWKVGEALTILKSEFPELQVKMRSVLRVEVEAVRFLKEEPHKMDSMLKRIKVLTEALGTLRRCVSESVTTARSAQMDHLKVLETNQGPLKTQSPQRSPKSQPSSSGIQPGAGLAGPPSPLLAHQMKSSAVMVIQPSHLHPTHGRGSLTVAKTTERQTETSRTDQPRNSTSTSRPPPPNTTTTDFEQVLQEDQASLMKKSIPHLDVSDNREKESDPDPASGETPAPLDIIPQGQMEQQAALSDHQGDKAPKMPNEVDSTQLKLSDIVSQPPAVCVEPPPSAPPSSPPSTPPSAAPRTECCRRPLVEKLHHSSMDEEKKQSPDKTGKSPPPPPPPPRRFHAVSPGLSTGRSGEVIFTTRKEPVGAQVELFVVPQPKPPRQPPKVKPKPQMCPPAHRVVSTSTPQPADMREEQEEQAEEEEEEDSKRMKELQVEVYKSAEQCKGEGGMSPTVKVADQKTPELLTSDQQLAPQTKPTADKHVIASGPEDAAKDKKEVEQEVFKVELITPDDVSPDWKNKGTPTATSLQIEEIIYQKDPASPDQISEESSPNPAPAEKKVKFMTTIMVQKANTQAASIREQTKEKPIRQAAATEKKSNLAVVVTLQKENSMSEDLSNSQHDKLISSDQDCTPPVLKPTTLSLCLSDNQQNQKIKVQDPSGYIEEGGSPSPEHNDDGPPTPSPSTDKISLQISKTRVTTWSKEEELSKTNGSDVQAIPGEISDDATNHTHESCVGENNDDFEKKPVIVILNDPIDNQSSYKWLSTILECEEDLDEILPPQNIVDEEEQNLGKLGLVDRNTGCGLTEITTNGQSSPHKTPPSESVSFPVTEDQCKPDPLTKSENKKKCKFKFPKNKLAAFSQAIRTGTTKTGRKTLEVVVYEEEEELAADSRPVKEAKKQSRESKRFEIKSSKLPSDFSEDAAWNKNISSPTETKFSKSHCRAEKLCKNALDSINSLEESIKQLEISVDSITVPSPDPTSDSSDKQLNSRVRWERDRSPSKRPASQIIKGPKPPQSKRVKSQASVKTSTKKQAFSSNSSSSAECLSKSRHSSSSGSPEKTPKSNQILQGT
ncbi:hypothetical protein LDENG_00066020 [Lucifuga dentata]|nr:hypothetical protein LDENG_00066020 [Lucifuga dentata]